MNHDIHNRDIVINNHGRRRRPLWYIFVPDKMQRRIQRRQRRRKALPLGQRQHYIQSESTKYRTPSMSSDFDGITILPN